MNTTHSSFLQPTDSSIPLWKYISLPKFISLLDNKSLFLCRSDLLGDPYEGTIPVFNASNIYTQFCDPTRPDLIIKVRKMFRLFTYVSCWHMNHVESEAMWRLHCPQNDGVALKTTYGKFTSLIKDSDIYIGRVRYIDYRSEIMPLDNLFNLIMYKRRAFEHEQEVRIVKQLPFNIQSVESDFDELKCLKENPPGISVPVDIGRIIDSIYVSPYAPLWYYDVVKTVIDKFSVNLTLNWSHIDDEPNY